jgi:hypothetical protein
VSSGIATVALVAVPIAYLQSQRLGVGEVVQPRYVLPLLTLVIGVVSVGPRLGRTLPMPRVPGVLIAVGLSASGILAFWAYAHRFMAGPDVGLFDPSFDVAWSSGTGIPPVATLTMTVLSTTVLAGGTVWLGARGPARR